MRPRFGAAAGAVLWLPLCLSLCLSLWLAAGASAQDVELRSLDGSIALEGDLLSYDGAFYRLETIYGPMTVSAEGVSCAGPGCPDLATFVAEARIAGAATVAEGLMPALLSAFAESRGLLAVAETDGPVTTILLRRPDGLLVARFTLTPGTTEDGFLALLNDEADIALALREPDRAEIEAAALAAPDDPALEDRVRVLALDALVPVVSPANPVDALSLTETARLFSGEIDSWQDLGGPDAPVALHLLAPGLGLSQSFATHLSLLSDATLSEGILRHDTATALAAAVAADPYAVGITARSGSGGARILPLSGSCGFTQAATVDAVKAEDYPLTAPVLLYLAPRRLPLLVRQFLAFTETEAAERRIREAGYVDQALTRTPLALQGERLSNAIRAAEGEAGLAVLQGVLALLDGAERLSTTLRFEPSGSDLDVPSRTAIARLAAALERGAFDGRRLIFVGFSDGEGPAGLNARLSLRRAGAARDALLAATDAAAPERVEIVVEGFGAAMPVSCDDTDWGRAVNRRVEVWLD